MHCKNCFTDLKENYDFCYNCGAKVIKNRLTVKIFFEHISETFFNYDNKLLRTFIELFTKPEDVIGSYINGVRKKYVNPISYFALALSISGIYLLIINKFFPETLDFSIFNFPGQEELQKRNVSFVQEYYSIVMMFYVPIYALMALLTFIGLKKFNYTELLVIFLYIQAQISIVTSVITIVTAMLSIPQGFSGLVLMPLMILYSAFCLKRLYELSTGNIILRTLLFLVILGIAFVILSVVMAIVMFLNGDLEQMIEAQKAARGT